MLVFALVGFLHVSIIVGEEDLLKFKMLDKILSISNYTNSNWESHHVPICRKMTKTAR